MEYYNNILCVTCEELTSGDNPVMKYITLYQNVRRGNIESINRGGGEGNVALYPYSSLPEKYKKRWVERHGEPEKQMREEMIRNIVKKDEKAERFFEEYRYDKNGELVALPEDVKKEYTWNASVLNALMEEFKRLSSSNNKLTGFRRNLWELLLVTSEEWRPVYGHSLPGSVGRLKALISKFRPDNYGVLVSGKYGNSNTLKIEEDGGRYLVALKRSRVPVYTDMEIFEEYNRVAPERGWKPLKSPRSLREWFSSPRVEPLWYDAVYGEMKAHQRYDRKHRTILPGRRDSLWYGDGTKLNLYYRDENGNKCTTSVYEVVDAYSEVLLGYYISDNEDYIAQYHAFRMAIQTSRHKPYEIVCDNQGGHKKNAALGLFSKISRIHRPTAPYNGESKTIENIFYRFQSQVLKKRFGFTGQNITAKRETSRPNLEFINANIDSLPTLEELKEQYAAAREQWNSMKHPATGIPRIEMYNTSVNEGTDPVSVPDMVEMFWYTTDKPSLFTASGIEITVQGKKYPYEVFSAPGEPDLEWRRRNTYKKFYVQYDPYDM
ncbi:kinase, partial [Phocaeicola vulgatus]